VIGTAADGAGEPGELVGDATADVVSGVWI
jgi:hypothetical protein